MAAARLQIAVCNTLVAEAVFETFAEAELAEARWMRLRYARGMLMGGAVIQRADLKRTWNVPVGSIINPRSRSSAVHHDSV